ncbi:hypothetical protein [Jiangella mangrovi]|uniref:Uncharacterized protein n=1 Tax=Jiangella mangrovi TaxID=1524084 RepID=A0A7W9GMD1_9ACTN|nr:hypothetical protein [Jiangella mangrovi]MBB5786331.1 hypothetical protein [Jiangella mangrovi]
MTRSEGKVPWYGRLTEILMPLLGPADVGRQDDAPPPRTVREVECPLCHHPMSEHRLEQVGGKNRHYCPA